MKEGLQLLAAAGCQTAYLGGSFVTKDLRPHDFDVCWDEKNPPVRWADLDPIFRQDLIGPLRAKAEQWHRFRGEFYPAGAFEAHHQCSFLDFFQRDTRDAATVRKGVVKLDLREVQ